MPYLTDFSSWFGNHGNNNQDAPESPPQTTKIIDPITGREIDTSSLKGAGADQSAASTIAHGFALDELFGENKDAALSGLMGLLGETKKFMQPNALDEKYVRNLVSLGVGQVGRQATAAQNSLAQSLAARGIGGNSPLAAGLQYQLQATNLGAVRNAQLSAETEALRLMAQQRALGLQSALGLGKDIASVQMAMPEYGKNALEGLSELQLQKYYTDKAASAGKKAAKGSAIGGILGGIGSVVGAIGSII